MWGDRPHADEKVILYRKVPKHEQFHATVMD